MAEGAIATRKNKVIETNINMVDSKVRFTIIVEGNFNMGVQQHKVNTYLENLKEVPFTNNSKLVPLTSMTLIHPAVRKLFTEVCKTVEKNYRQPRIFFNSEGVSDIIHKSPGSGVASKHNKNVRTTISACAPGNIRVAGEGSYSESRNNLRGVSEQPFSCGKEGWGTPSGDTSEKTKYIHTLRAL